MKASKNPCCVLTFSCLPREASGDLYLATQIIRGDLKLRFCFPPLTSRSLNACSGFPLLRAVTSHLTRGSRWLLSWIYLREITLRIPTGPRGCHLRAGEQGGEKAAPQNRTTAPWVPRGCRSAGARTPQGQRTPAAERFNRPAVHSLLSVRQEVPRPQASRITAGPCALPGTGKLSCNHGNWRGWLAAGAGFLRAALGPLRKPASCSPLGRPRGHR